MLSQTTAYDYTESSALLGAMTKVAGAQSRHFALEAHDRRANLDNGSRPAAVGELKLEVGGARRTWVLRVGVRAQRAVAVKSSK